MKTLILNAGSSSIKYKLFEMSNEQVLAEGLVERIGEAVGKIRHIVGDKETLIEEHFADHRVGLDRVANLLVDRNLGVIKSSKEVTKVVHRVVHGGDKFVAPALLNQKVIDAIKENISLAPLHNPPNLLGIEVSLTIFKEAVQIGVFDTAFHQTMDEDAYSYALPKELVAKHKIRRYGFHGTSHSYVAKRSAEILGKDLSKCNLITLHLGNGCSAAAIQRGKSIDTSMGLTPLEGLVMGTRCGDLDPAIPFFLSKEEGISIEEVDKILNKQSGLKGLCGSNDLRDIALKCEKGDSLSRRALDIYVRRIKKYIGSYIAVIGPVDAIVFTAGVGENSAIVREMVCAKLDHLGIEIDKSLNEQKGKSARMVQTVNSKVKILVVPTNEELEMARLSEEI